MTTEPRIPLPEPGELRADAEQLVAAIAPPGREPAKTMAVLAYQPDIIVLDLLMPYLEGQDELKLLQMHPTARRIPVIVVTAYPERVGNPDDLKKMGVVEIFTKPVSIDVLETAVKRALA